ncbi:MAG: hypothetical protein KF782_21810 [Labilithrix sp.]|nr:hypothetical protein [Labilithrix sp.]
MRRTSSPSITLRSHLHAPRTPTGWRRRGRRGSTPVDPELTRRHTFELTSGVCARVATLHAVSRSAAPWSAPLATSRTYTSHARRPPPPPLGARRQALLAPPPPRRPSLPPSPRHRDLARPARLPAPSDVLGVATVFGVALGAALVGVTLGVVGPSPQVAALMLASGAALAALVATRRDAVDGSTTPSC